MHNRTYKKPTRRKPGGPYTQGQYSTVEHYDSPWWVTFYALLIVAAIIGIPAILAATHMMGWW